MYFPRSAKNQGDGVEIELAQLRPLHSGIKGRHYHAPARVADDHEIIAGRKHRSPPRLDSHALRPAKDTYVDDRPFDDLTQRIAAQLSGDVVDTDERLPGQQCRT